VEGSGFKRFFCRRASKRVKLIAVGSGREAPTADNLAMAGGCIFLFCLSVHVLVPRGGQGYITKVA
jgi:radical SAM superfamily enzyme